MMAGTSLGPTLGWRRRKGLERWPRDPDPEIQPQSSLGPRSSSLCNQVWFTKWAVHVGCSRDGCTSPTRTIEHMLQMTHLADLQGLRCATTANSRCICRAALCKCGWGHFSRQAPRNGDVKSLPCCGLTYPTFSSVGFFLLFFPPLSLTCSSYLLRKGGWGGSVMITCWMPNHPNLGFPHRPIFRWKFFQSFI